jgi:NADPH:quinone reductase-like Zn-dependent oxidoreductase
VARNVAASAVDGRIALIALQGGAKAELDLRALLSKRLTLSASTLRAQPVQSKGRLVAAVRERVWPLFASRGLKPVIQARFPLAEAAAAHRLMEGGTHVGKILLLA